MVCCNKRVNQNHMKILSIILALFATSFAVHAQTYTKAELTQAAYNIQQGHNEGAKICLTYKAQLKSMDRRNKAKLLIRHSVAA